jgi:thiazole synthase
MRHEDDIHTAALGGRASGTGNACGAGDTSGTGNASSAGDASGTGRASSAGDAFVLGAKSFTSRFILGSGKFTLDLVTAAIASGGAEVVTLALRRANARGNEDILDHIPSHVTLLPNTSGARSATEALRIARLARELGCGDFIKIEVINDSRYLLPDSLETLRAVELLAKEGFVPLPYMYPDLSIARRMRDAGAAAVMPLGAPIGSNKGLLTRDFVSLLVAETDVPVIVDAGLGRPSQACEAMELGCAAVMANTGIATAGDVAGMARAFRLAIEAGRAAYLAGLGRVLDGRAEASSPLTGFLDGDGTDGRLGEGSHEA